MSPLSGKACSGPAVHWVVSLPPFTFFNYATFGPNTTCTKDGGAWSELLDSMVEEEPFSVEDELKFIPRIFHFPVTVQKFVLDFIYQYRHEIHHEDIKKLVSSFEKHKSEDSWILALQDLLKDYTSCVNASTKLGGIEKNEDPASGCCYKFTSTNSEQMETLLSKIRSFDSNPGASHSPWRPLCLPNQTDVDIAEGTGPGSSQDGVHTSGYDGEVFTQFSQRPSYSPTHDGFSHKKRKLSLSDAEVDASMDHVNTKCTMEDGDQSISSIEFPLSQSQSIDIVAQVRQLGEIWSIGEADDTGRCPEEVHVITACNAAQMESLCRQLKLNEMTETCLLTACLHVTHLQQEISHVNCVLFAKNAILPKVMSLKQTASRTLLHAVAKFSEVYQKPVAEGVLIPCLLSSHIETCQADLISRVLKEAYTSESRQTFLSVLLNVEGDLQWTDSSVVILQLLLDQKVEIDGSTMEKLISSLAASSTPLANSMKFGKVILAVITKYAKQLNTGNAERLKMILEGHKTFLKKSALAALNKLKL